MLQQIYKRLSQLAGVRSDAIEKAPNALITSAAFGLALLVTSLISSLTMAYALLRVFYAERYAWFIAVGGGLLWWPLIFSIDRVLLNSTTTGPLWARVLKTSVRFAVATIVGISISIPIFLEFERNNIDLVLYQGNRAAMAREAQENAQLAGLPDGQAAYTRAVSDAREAAAAVAAGPGSSPEYGEAVRARDAAETRERTDEARNLVAIEDAEERLKSFNSGSPAANAVQLQIQLLRNEIRQSRQDLARARAEVERAESAWRTAADQRLKETRSDEADAQKALRAEAEMTAKADAVSASEINRLSTPNLATEYAIAVKIMSDSRNPQAAAMKEVYYGLHFLFILIELLVVTVKLTMPPTAIDSVVTACEELDRERTTLEVNARILGLQRTTTAATNVHQHGIQEWENLRLQQVQENRPVSAADLQALKDECAAAIAAAM